MTKVLIYTTECESPRWARLCGLLKVGTPEQQTVTLGMLCTWYMRWARQPELDSGIWLRSSLNEVGEWSGCGKEHAMRWGRALLASGYVGLLKDLYPEPLASVRNGYAALDPAGGVMLDEIFPVLKRRSNASMLVHYIMGRDRRCYWADKLGLDAQSLEISGQVPTGWLQRSNSAPAMDGTESDEMGAVPGMVMASRRVEAPAEPSAPAYSERRQVIGFASANENAGRVPERTGNTPTTGMLATVRQYRYSDPLRALMALDSREAACWVWKRVLAKNRELACQEIAKLVETDHQWSLLRNPAGVITANFRRMNLLD